MHHRRARAKGAPRQCVAARNEFYEAPPAIGTLEARATVQNGRGNGALRKMGAVREAILRQSFLRNGRYFDQVLYSILKDDWHAAREYALVFGTAPTLSSPVISTITNIGILTLPTTTDATERPLPSNIQGEVR